MELGIKVKHTPLELSVTGLGKVNQNRSGCFPQRPFHKQPPPPPKKKTFGHSEHIYQGAPMCWAFGKSIGLGCHSLHDGNLNETYCGPDPSMLPWCGNTSKYSKSMSPVTCQQQLSNWSGLPTRPSALFEEWCHKIVVWKTKDAFVWCGFSK